MSVYLSLYIYIYNVSLSLYLFFSLSLYISLSLSLSLSFSHSLLFRRLAETRGDFAEAADMEDYESKKPKLARQIIAGKRKRKTERKIERSTVREIGK